MNLQCSHYFKLQDSKFYHFLELFSVDISTPFNPTQSKAYAFWLIYSNYELVLMDVVILDQIFSCVTVWNIYQSECVNVSVPTHRAQLTLTTRHKLEHRPAWAGQYGASESLPWPDAIFDLSSFKHSAVRARLPAYLWGIGLTVSADLWQHRVYVIRLVSGTQDTDNGHCTCVH